MNKIRKIRFIDHPILGNLKLDFCGKDGNAVDTVIIAGENGTGKSAVLNCLYDISAGKCNFQASVEIQTDDHGVRKLDYYSKTINGKNSIWVTDHNGMDTLPGHNEFENKYHFAGVFSDVDINFRAQDISSVTSMALDTVNGSRRSSTNLPQQINQLLIDIQALDDGELSHAYREAKATNRSTDEIRYTERMARFTTAFNRMLETLTYSHIENQRDKKLILFQKFGVDVPVESLSSGEKQIIYRGCFLLKDVNATKGAFVFIDEPEISLHPNWQMKIMDYYKGIFTDEDGKQTSQIFAVTHSPFVIHNEHRRNDKVIVLAHDEEGKIIAKDKPDYFKCDSVEAVQDAFAIQGFDENTSTVYLEGRTDEKYFNRALQVYDCNVPFQFRWVGYLDDRGQEVNTGEKSVDAAYQFLVGRNLAARNFCLKDCDTNREPKTKNNTTILSIPLYENVKGIKRGIENALVLDEIDLSPYYTTKTTMGDYGDERNIQTFEKMACCDGICALDDDILKRVFVNLKAMIDYLEKLYTEV